MQACLACQEADTTKGPDLPVPRVERKAELRKVPVGTGIDTQVTEEKIVDRTGRKGFRLRWGRYTAKNGKKMWWN